MTKVYIRVGEGAASLVVIIVLIHLGRRRGDGPPEQQDVWLCKDSVLASLGMTDNSLTTPPHNLLLLPHSLHTD